MKFYDCSTAPSPRRVRIFMAEKGIKIARRTVAKYREQMKIPPVKHRRAPR